VVNREEFARLAALLDSGGVEVIIWDVYVLNDEAARSTAC